MSNAISTEDAPRPGGFYSQGVRAGGFIFVAGQLALDRAGKFTGGSMRDQARQAMDNVAAILRAGGGTLADLVQVTVYVTDIQYWGEFNEAYKEIMKDVSFPPARAVVPVKDLHFGALLEIQAIAMVGGGGPSR
jgi:2-iminobutanoate/2-iminopropanoate deaminase